MLQPIIRRVPASPGLPFSPSPLLVFSVWPHRARLNPRLEQGDLHCAQSFLRGRHLFAIWCRDALIQQACGGVPRQNRRAALPATQRRSFRIQAQATALFLFAVTSETARGKQRANVAVEGNGCGLRRPIRPGQQSKAEAGDKDQKNEFRALCSCGSDSNFLLTLHHNATFARDQCLGTGYTLLCWII